MVHIKLCDEWSLESDSRQWILVQGSRYMYFFSNLEDCLKSYFDLKTKCSQTRTISGLMKAQKDILNTLQQALTPLNLRVKIEIPEQRGVKNEN